MPNVQIHLKETKWNRKFYETMLNLPNNTCPPPFSSISLKAASWSSIFTPHSSSKGKAASNSSKIGKKMFHVEVKIKRRSYM
jgi:hypothetical protein